MIIVIYQKPGSVTFPLVADNIQYKYKLRPHTVRAPNSSQLRRTLHNMTAHCAPSMPFASIQNNSLKR